MRQRIFEVMRSRMAKFSETVTPWKAELMVDTYFFSGEMPSIWPWGSRGWGLCPGRGLLIMEKETYRTFGDLMGWNKKKKKTVTQNIAFPHYLCWILKMNGVRGKKQNKKQSQELLGGITETSEISVQELLG